MEKPIAPENKPVILNENGKLFDTGEYEYAASDGTLYIWNDGWFPKVAYCNISSIKRFLIFSVQSMVKKGA